MSKFKESFGDTPADLPDLRDAGCCTGMDVPEATGVSEASFKRGFRKVGRRDADPFADDGGFLTRPGGWER